MLPRDKEDGTESSSSMLETENSTVSKPPWRLWWLRGAAWYILVVMFSGGFLTAIPYFHAAWTLRDRRIQAYGILYILAQILAAVLLSIRFSNSRSYDIFVITTTASAGVYILGANFYILKIRWQVFAATARKYIKNTEDEKKAAVYQSWVFAEQHADDWFFVPLAIVATSILLVVFPIVGVVATVTGKPGLPKVIDAEALIATVTFTCFLIWWLAVKYNSDAPLRQHLIVLGTAISVNAYLGFSIWLVIDKIIHPSASERVIGMMVWWNLSHAVPVVDVDSALGWEQPWSGYPVEIGWLFLLQRVVLLLTLARVIQLLFDRWIRFSKAKSSEVANSTDSSGQAEVSKASE